MGYMKDLDRRIRQGGDDAMAAVGELLPRWIPVSERLPDDDLEMVLLTDGEWVTFGRQSGDGWYVEESAEALGPRELSRFTHWMPLPEPPEVK